LIAVIQRTKSGAVKVKEKIIGQIDKGFVIFLGVTDTDRETDADYLADKIAHIRVFKDNNDKMNFSIQDISGSALVISQFTLCGDTRKGRRPSFIHAAYPDKGKALYEYFIGELKSKDITISSGEFGVNMEVSLVNDGPVTFVLDSNNR
jgi:D-tyrosyl-tRNA(Tyr) deacylase